MLRICITFTRQEKAHAARKAAVEVVVAVTKTICRGSLALLLAGSGVQAKVLPEDRADMLYHGYDGGGVSITGPSVLVRKAYKDKVSVWGNYYVDMISGASIDVEATASKYSETREEVSFGVDYLHDKTLMGIGFTQSEEDMKSVLEFTMNMNIADEDEAATIYHTISEESAWIWAAGLSGNQWQGIHRTMGFFSGMYVYFN